MCLCFLVFLVLWIPHYLLVIAKLRFKECNYGVNVFGRFLNIIYYLPKTLLCCQKMFYCFLGEPVNCTLLKNSLPLIKIKIIQKLLYGQKSIKGASSRHMSCLYNLIPFVKLGRKMTSENTEKIFSGCAN